MVLCIERSVQERTNGKRLTGDGYRSSRGDNAQPSLLEMWRTVKIEMCFLLSNQTLVIVIDLHFFFMVKAQHHT